MNNYYPDIWLNVSSLLDAPMYGDGNVVLDQKSIHRLKYMIAKLNALLETGVALGVLPAKKQELAIASAKLILDIATYYCDGPDYNFQLAKAELEALCVNAWVAIERKKARLSQCKNPSLDDIPFCSKARRIISRHGLNTVSDLANALAEDKPEIPELNGRALAQIRAIIDIYGYGDTEEEIEYGQYE